MGLRYARAFRLERHTHAADTISISSARPSHPAQRPASISASMNRALIRRCIPQPPPQTPCENSNNMLQKEVGRPR